MIPHATMVELWHAVNERQGYLVNTPRGLPGFTARQHMEIAKAQLNERLGGILDHPTMADGVRELDLSEAMEALVVALAHFGAGLNATWTVNPQAVKLVTTDPE